MSLEKFEIARLRLDDLEDVQAAYSLMLEESSDPMMALRVNSKQHAWEMRKMRQQCLAEQRYIAFVARALEGGDCLGYIAAVIQKQASLFEVESYAQLGELWVQPDKRRQGLGRALLQSLREACQELGLPFLCLDVHVSLSGARAFFEKEGCEVATWTLRQKLL